MLNIIIPLNPITKKNSQRIIKNRATGRPLIIQSETYKQYEKDCGFFLAKFSGRDPIDEPINLKCLFYRKDRRGVDLSNCLEAIQDVLVKYGVIKDDKHNIVVSVDGSRVLYDKDNPRTEIY
ncbi:MAG TPA: hypothetical protein PLA64_13770, partial [Mesotoga infera]|nr:hypothetical protein [Mesotoga infera]